MAKKSADPLDGVKCFSIGGRMIMQRQRQLGMTDDERRWRAQWLKDQILSPDEPRDVPEYYKETTNIFRRIYKTPMHWFYLTLKKKLGADNAFLIRHTVGKLSFILLGTYMFTYFVKYHSNDFSVGKTVEIAKMREPMLPHQPDYPNYYVKQPYEYYDQGFYSSVLCQDVEPPEPPPPEELPIPPSEDQICPEKEEQNLKE